MKRWPRSETKSPASRYSLLNGAATARACPLSVVGKFRLDRGPGCHIDDCLVLPRMDHALVRDSADVDRVGQQLVDMPTGEWPSASLTTLCRDAARRLDVISPQPVQQRRNRPLLQIQLEDRSDGFCVAVDDQPAVDDVVAHGWVTTHPHALPLGGRDLVADALAGDLALELSEGQEHVEHQPAHRGRGVELLGDRDERDPVLVEGFGELCEVGEGAGEPVDLVDDDDIDLALADHLHEAARDRDAPCCRPRSRHRQSDPAISLQPSCAWERT